MKGKGLLHFALGVLAVLGIGAVTNQAFPPLPELAADAGSQDALMAPPGGSQIVDPYLQTVDATGIDVANQVVPKASVIAYCGDGDGCTVRIALVNPGSSRGINPIRYSERFFSTLADGSKWIVLQSDSTPDWEGSTEDETANLLMLVDDSTQTCELRDDPVFNSFQLKAVPDGIDLRCVLRIDD
jgi:hypothetical protein